MTPTETFLRARDLLLQHRDDYEKAYAAFSPPEMPVFNWALDWFDVLAKDNRRPALWIVREGGEDEIVSFAEMSERSARVANFLRGMGVRRGDRILMMLPTVLATWEVMLAATKLGAVIIPASMQLTPADLADRVSRGAVRHVVTEAACAERFQAVEGDYTRIAVGGGVAGWTAYEDALAASADFAADGETRAEDPLLLYFTSGTTAKPKLVLHTHQSYPVGHLSTMYWVGMREGDVHQNISSPGWAKHAWSSFFAPWNAGATVLVHDYARFSAKRSLEVLSRAGVGTLCAPPTVWRMLIVEDLGQKPAALKELVSAGEPLNPEVIERVRQSWGITIRDGYGQTETTAQIGNSPGQEVVLGSMGRPLPGYSVALVDGEGRETGGEGEIALRLDPRPRGLMVGYADDPERTAAVMAGGFYRTGDEATRDERGYYHYVGRGDDVFKSSDYRISPFELESVLIEHPAVAECAIVPSPDPMRLAVPKAFVALAPGKAPSEALAREILLFAKEKLAPYKRVRRLEFMELPKTISGKIRRVELRSRERDLQASGGAPEGEHRLEEIEKKG
ncbi:AMP-binding protein [Polyangium aurulentum]|uniref:AMP-binding protein n=1 Tax=Polyangium aurulentum TaxID=2567896 RepID=UPI0010AE0725|nr:AMP-binding protein [Polyangium aurulentum]UQA55822.1 AMP-binding protein [Polyangium aurulentum]